MTSIVLVLVLHSACTLILLPIVSHNSLALVPKLNQKLRNPKSCVPVFKPNTNQQTSAAPSKPHNLCKIRSVEIKLVSCSNFAGQLFRTHTQIWQLLFFVRGAFSPTSYPHCQSRNHMRNKLVQSKFYYSFTAQFDNFYAKRVTTTPAIL